MKTTQDYLIEEARIGNWHTASLYGPTGAYLGTTHAWSRVGLRTATLRLIARLEARRGR